MMPLRYQGGKYKCGRQLVSLAPLDVDEYREPFAGGIGVFWHLPKSIPRWVNDINADVIRFYKSLRDDPTFINRILRAKENLVDADVLKTTFHLSKLEWMLTGCPLAYLLLNRYAYGQFVKRSRCNVASFAWTHLRNGLQPITRQSLSWASDMLHDTRITCGQYWKLLDAPGRNVWLFVDPPYHIEDHGQPLYDDAFEIDHHEELRERLLGCKHRFLLTLEKSELSHRLWVRGTDFEIQERRMRYSGVLRKKQTVKMELWISNY